MPQKTKAQICDFVNNFRERCGNFGFIEGNGEINLALVLEYLEYIWDGWSFNVADHDEMGALLGKACPAEKLITLRLDVYEGAVNRHPEHCFTVAHELGHMVMHSDFAFARREGPEPGSPELLNVEQEADFFAETLLGFNSPFIEDAVEQFKKIIYELKNIKKNDL